MFEIVDATNAHLYERALDQMFQLRYEFYVKERGWTELRHENGRERDQFDHQWASYLLAFDDNRDIMAGGRFIPTTAPHLIADVFPQLVERGPVPRGPSIYEFTRIFVAPGWRDTPVFGKLLCAKLEYLQMLGCTRETVIGDTFFIPLLLEIGWDLEFLGLPVNDGRDEYVALTFVIDHEILDRTRRFYGIAERLVYYADPETGEALSNQEPSRLRLSS